MIGLSVGFNLLRRGVTSPPPLAPTSNEYAHDPAYLSATGGSAPVSPDGVRHFTASVDLTDYLANTGLEAAAITRVEWTDRTDAQIAEFGFTPEPAVKIDGEWYLWFRPAGSSEPATIGDTRPSFVALLFGSGASIPNVRIRVRTAGGWSPLSGTKTVTTGTAPASPVANGTPSEQTIDPNVAISTLALSDFVDEAGANPDVTSYQMAPGSASLPAGLALNTATGDITGTPTEEGLADRTCTIRAFSATGFLDIDVPFTFLVRNYFPSGAPTRFGNDNATANTTASAVAGGYRVSSVNGTSSSAFASWEIPTLTEGDVATLTAEFDRVTASQNLIIRVGNIPSNGFTTGVGYEVTATNPDNIDLSAGVSVTIPAAADQLGVAAIFQRPDTGVYTADFTDYALRHARTATTGLPDIASTDPLLIEVGDAQDVDLIAAYFTNVSYVELDTTSNPLPAGLYLAGGRLKGTTSVAGTTSITLRGYNDQDEFISVTFDLTAATSLADQTHAAPLFFAGTAVSSYDVGQFFTLSDIDRVEVVATGEAFPDGLTINPATAIVSGTPVAVTDGDGAVVLLRAYDDTAGEVQDLSLRVTVRGTPTSAITGSWTSTAGVTNNGTEDGAQKFTISSNGNRQIYRAFTLAAGITATYRVGIEYTVGGFRNAGLRIGPNLTGTNRILDSDNDFPSGSGYLYYTGTITIDAPSAGGAGLMQLYIDSAVSGDVFRIVEFEIIDLAVQTVTALARDFDIAIPSNAPASLYVAPMWVGPTTYSDPSTTLPSGLAFTTSGLIHGTPASTGETSVTLRGSTAVNSADQTFTLTVADGQYYYPGTSLGPHGCAFTNGNDLIQSSVFRLGQSSWRVQRTGGANLAAWLMQMWDCTRGGRYTLSVTTAQGTLPSSARIRVYVSPYYFYSDFSGEFGGETLLGSYAATGTGITDIEFTAPDNMFWLRVEADATGNQSFLVNGVTISAVTGDEWTAAEDVQSVSGGYRLWNLQYGRKYTLTAATTGATSVTVGTTIGGGTTDTLGTTGGDFIATREIMFVRTDGAFDSAPTLERVGTAPYDVTSLTPDSGLRFPMLDAYPDTGALSPDMIVDPASGMGFTHTTLDAALEAAEGGEIILCRPGAMGNVSLSGKTYTSMVEVVAEEKYGSTLANITLASVRKLSLRGLRIQTKLTFSGSCQEIDLLNNLIAPTTLAAVPIPVDTTGEHFHIRLRSNEFVGDPSGAFNLNKIGKAVNCIGWHWSEISGNRFTGIREDTIVCGGQNILFARNLLLDAYPFTGTVGGVFIGDHADAWQPQFAFLRPNRYMKWFQNVHADDFNNVQTGTGKQHSLLAGRQRGGFAFVRIEDNIFSNENGTHGISLQDCPIGYEVFNNTLPGASGSQLYRSNDAMLFPAANAGTYQNNIAPNTGGSSNAVLVRRVNVVAYDDADFERPADIYGLKPKAATSATDKGAYVLGAELFAESASPAALTEHEWTMATGPNPIITIVVAPLGSDTRLSAWEYRVNGGTATTLTGITWPTDKVSAAITASAGQTVEIRANTAAGNGAWSDAKTVVS